MATDIRERLVEIESRLSVEQFTVSASIRNAGINGSRDTFLSITVKPQVHSLTEIPLAVFATERKLALLALMDAAAKGIISNEEMRSARDAQDKNYQTILEKLLTEKPK